MVRQRVQREMAQFTGQEAVVLDVVLQTKAPEQVITKGSDLTVSEAR